MRINMAREPSSDHFRQNALQIAATHTPEEVLILVFGS